MKTALTVPRTLANAHPLVSGLPPRWAWEWGEDRYGPWCAIRVQGAVQRLRWILPGRFLMGSPPGEEGRFPDEGAQRLVRISEGFWLFDTPCTQALWQVLMGENPSRFQSPTRPVEQVSWDDCKVFLARLNARLIGLELSLPSEAQWEYACRAGSNQATYAGNLEILGKHNAPILDVIAWYGGNCGVDFELREGSTISGWEQKQYERKVGGTHPVALKTPNAWGLYDMLGNVWEWCADPWGTITNERPSESKGARVVRGASWRSIARYLRAGYRGGGEPRDRVGRLGFRCGEFRAGEDSE
jgi:formylglycine-generating enzyme required for sulfatase activity